MEFGIFFKPNNHRNENEDPRDQGGPSGAHHAHLGKSPLTVDEEPVEPDIESDSAEENPERGPWAVEGIGVIFEGQGRETGDDGTEDHDEEGAGQSDHFWRLPEVIEGGEKCGADEKKKEGNAEGDVESIAATGACFFGIVSALGVSGLD